MTFILIVLIALLLIGLCFFIVFRIEDHEKRIRHLEKHEHEKSDLIERMWRVILKIVTVLRRYHLWAARNTPPKDDK